MLACARDRCHSFLSFWWLQSQSIADRLQDAQARFIVTCDGAFRGGKDIPLKDVIDDALVTCPFVERVIVLTRTRTPVSKIKGRDVWWEEEIHRVETMGNPPVPAVEMDAEDPLFILYTSGSTGKPKGGTHRCRIYDMDNLHFCQCVSSISRKIFTSVQQILAGSPDIPISSTALWQLVLTTLMFEGIPTWPDAGRFWDIVDKYRVNMLYTAPTAIRSLMSFGLGPPRP